MANMSAAVMTSTETEHEAQAADEAQEANSSSSNDSCSPDTLHKTMTGDKDDKTTASVSPSGRVTHVRQLFVGNVCSVTII